MGILFLVAANILKIDNMKETAERLSLYMITVILGLSFHALISMNMVYFLIVRKNPFIFLKGMLQVINKLNIKRKKELIKIIFNKNIYLRLG